MPKDFDDLRLKHMDTRLAGWRRLRGETPPRGGWLRAIRTALGISTGQLARRLGVAQQAIVKFEQNEAASKITLESLERVAKALGCRVVYAVIPEKPLGVVRRARALVLAEALVRRGEHSMKLEAQGVSRSERERQRKRLAEQLLHGSPRKLWR